MQTGRASGVVAADGRMSLRDIEVSPPGPSEVMVEMAAAGICHTDHDMMTSAASPLLLGHEGAGTVVAVGDGVTSVRPGDRVVLTWAIACGTCFQCLHGNPTLCSILGPGAAGHAHPEATRLAGTPLRRSFNLGTMSTLAVVRAEAVRQLPAEVPLESACLLGCAVMTGVGSVLNVARVSPGASVVVVGCGGVGLNAIQGARIAGAEPILAIDLVADRLESARLFGATHTHMGERADTTLQAAAETVRALTGGRGADYVFEATAVPQLAAEMLRLVRNGGMAVQLSGVEQALSVDMRLFEWDKTYINPLYGGCRPWKDFDHLCELYLRGELMLDELVARRYRLADFQDGFADMLAGHDRKGILVMA